MDFHAKTHLAGIFIILAISTAFYFTAKNDIQEFRQQTENTKKNTMLKYIITCRYRRNANNAELENKTLFYSNGEKSVFSETPNAARIYNTPKEASDEIKRLKNIYPSLVLNYGEIILNIQN